MKTQVKDVTNYPFISQCDIFTNQNQSNNTIYFSIEYQILVHTYVIATISSLYRSRTSKVDQKYKSKIVIHDVTYQPNVLPDCNRLHYVPNNTQGVQNFFSQFRYDVS